MTPAGVHDWTPDTDPTYRAVLNALGQAGVDLDRITMTPDGQFTLTTDDGRIAFGNDDQTDGEWWVATAHDSRDHEPTLIYQGPSLPDLAAQLAAQPPVGLPSGLDPEESQS